MAKSSNCWLDFMCGVSPYRLLDGLCVHPDEVQGLAVPQSSHFSLQSEVGVYLLIEFSEIHRAFSKFYTTPVPPPPHQKAAYKMG